jgi:hypothetical protein
MARLMVVSNRVVVPGRNAGAVGVLAALRGPELGVWFGWSGRVAESPSSEPEAGP